VNTGGSGSPSSGSALSLAPGVTVDPSAVRTQFARSGGPGGQNVNKLNTKAEIWIPLAAIRGLSAEAMARFRLIAGGRITTANEIHIASDEHRSQEANRQEVFDRLRLMLIEARKIPRKRRPTRPSRGARERRLQSKKVRGQIKSERRYRGE
jgi:ribosome-associated protein